MTIGLAIPHTPWVPERVASLSRLREQLGLQEGIFARFREEIAVDGAWRLFTDREPNYVWSERLWEWGLETGADYLLQLQDDVEVSPRFWEQLRAMLEAVPDRVIGLEAAHPRGRQLARSGVRWYTTADMLIGVGYVLPRSILVDFLLWRQELRQGAVESVTEDTLLGCFCLSTGHRIWHPIPTIIDHDTSIESTYGNEAHEHRRPSVTWKDSVLADAGEFWRPRSVPHLGRFYASTPATCRRWVEGFGDREYRRAMDDVWRGETS